METESYEKLLGSYFEIVSTFVEKLVFCWESRLRLVKMLKHCFSFMEDSLFLLLPYASRLFEGDFKVGEGQNVTPSLPIRLAY